MITKDARIQVAISEVLEEEAVQVMMTYDWLCEARCAAYGSVEGTRNMTTLQHAIARW